ncbi:cAMP-binding domain of CRP or a regulatory subunit of cAMP-dependent protein kinases [Aquiflexum balticum DSM 16537]|uniref:cAMP-binding domain of CRP or a regulatory subunit of cAMP-dependent protein kinases n=1 Tax=Aquiflexum balticum DSM 16537 TaxID=758820 RepID=A0A1W2HAJ3_9BACT|nr:Crp/Fnr family transcriptional regulator [Aquiflexum balticum]SMD45893.1 cAMP-binding domain of CRP or a regulatory subunit of cAMP-dependent protein kinases [Aquiflexum balticum DSM 16537]
MKSIYTVIQQMINISHPEWLEFSGKTQERKFKRNELLSSPGTVPHEIFFIEHGIVRVIITDKAGTEHTVHFALENQFIADYTSFLLQEPSLYSIQALEETTTVVLPREAIEWGYTNLKDGQKLGRLIAEFYFIYQDNRVRNIYARTPKERYDSITQVFPNIHNRVPQHMIASYLGISPVHLSRLKKSDR